jgi:hypothetical protein
MDTADLPQQRPDDVRDQRWMRHAVGEDGIQCFARIERKQIAQPLHLLDVQALRLERRLNGGAVLGMAMITAG